MAELQVQVNDLDQLGSVAIEDFVHIKQVSDLGDYKITVEDFAASLSTSLNLGDFSTINQVDRSIIAGSGLIGGGNLSSNVTLNLGTPLGLSSTSTNSSTATSHSHSVTTADTTIKGLVELATNTEALTGTDTERAITPSSLKNLLLNKTVTAGNGLTGGGSLDSNPTVTLGTPLSITKTSTNSTTATGHTHAFAVNDLVPVGGIIMWSGSIASIPSTWALCDGTNGTPNLVNRFIVGAGNLYGVGATGGSKDAVIVSHTHSASSTVTDPQHTHSYDLRTSASGGAKGAIEGASGSYAGKGSAIDLASTGITVATSVNAQGVSGADKNLPPYYALAYIMKIG